MYDAVIFMTMDDAIIVTSLVLRTQSVSAVFCPTVFFCNSQVLITAMQVTRKENKFKRQTLTFHFSMYRPNSFKYLSRHTPVRPYERTDCCDHCIIRQDNTAISFVLINNNFSTTSILSFYSKRIAGLIKRLSPYTGRISRLNGICAQFFCPPKLNN